MIGKIKKGITIAKKIGAKRKPSTKTIAGGSRTGAFTKAQKEYAVDTLGADQVKQMMKEGFTKEQILIKAKKSGGPLQQGGFDRRARDIAEGGMRNPTRPGLKFKKGGATMKKKMMSAGGTMKKKMMSAGGATTQKKKMMAGGGASMYKKGYAAGGAAMKKKLFAPGGVTSSYDLADARYPGGGETKNWRKTKAKKKPVVTKAMMTKAGVTSLRDFYNKMEVNTAGTGYKKRSKALTRRGTSSAPKSKSRKSTMSQANPKLKFGTQSRSGTTVKPKKRKAGPMGFKKFFTAWDKRLGFK